MTFANPVDPRSLNISDNDASEMPFPGSFEELDAQSSSSPPLLHHSVDSIDHEKQSSCSDSIEDMEELDNEEEDEAWEGVVDEMEDETNEEEFDDYAPVSFSFYLIGFVIFLSFLIPEITHLQSIIFKLLSFSFLPNC